MNIGVRITEQQNKSLQKIMKEIESLIPAGEISLSSLIRQAIDDFIKSYYMRTIENAVKLEIPLVNNSEEELEMLYKHFFELRKYSRNSMFDDDVDGQYKKILESISLLLHTHSMKKMESRLNSLNSNNNNRIPNG